MPIVATLLWTVSTYSIRLLHEVYRYDATVLKKINKIWLAVLKTQKITKFIFSLLKKSAFIISAGDSKGHNDSRFGCVKRKLDKYFWCDDQFNSSF